MSAPHTLRLALAVALAVTGPALAWLSVTV